VCQRVKHSESSWRLVSVNRVRKSPSELMDKKRDLSKIPVDQFGGLWWVMCLGGPIL
jgi:hypothetical protein